MTSQIAPPFTAHVLLRKPGNLLTYRQSPLMGIPDARRAAFQHQALGEAITACGVSITALPPDPLFPDDCFVNDMAVVTETLAVLCNFAPDSPRQGARKSVATQLAATHFLKFITTPGLLDARDVLQAGDHFYIGLSPRTNQEGAAQLAYFLTEYGYQAEVIDLSDGTIPLRDAAVWLGANRLLVRENLAPHYAFLTHEKIIVPDREKGAANALLINGTLLLPAGYAETVHELKRRKIAVSTVNVSEFEKMNGGLSGLVLCLPPRGAQSLVRLPKKISQAA